MCQSLHDTHLSRHNRHNRPYSGFLQQPIPSWAGGQPPAGLSPGIDQSLIDINRVFALTQMLAQLMGSLWEVRENVGEKKGCGKRTPNPNRET